MLHVGGSYTINTISYNYYAKNTDYKDSELELMAFGTTLGLGILKELIDDKFDWKDIEADVIGAGAGSLVRLKF